MKNFILALFVFVLGTSAFAQLDRSKAPEPQPNPEIGFQIPDAMTFSNGMKVIIVENHKLPVVSFQLFADYPRTLEGDKIGLRSIFGEMLEAGTEKTPKDEFDKKIDYIGATLFTTSRGFYASSLKKHTPALLELLTEMITAPAFAQEDFDRIVAQNMSGLASVPSDANSMSANASDVINYGGNHPYGEIMTEETLGNITLEDVKSFYQRNFIPNHAYLVIVGDVSKDEAKHYVEDYFETWKKSTDLEKESYAVPESKGQNVYFVNKPGAVQSVINITHNVELTPGHEDELTLSVLNQILGGGSFSARLMSNLREDKAYTYGCYSSFDSDALMGSFSAGGSFRNEVTDSAIVQILAEIKRIAEEPVSDKELDLVKKSMTGAFARSLESPQTIANFALNTIRYNLPGDYYSNYLLRLEKVTKEDLLMAASEYLSPENINIVVVGNEEIAEKLAKLDSDGKISFKDYYGQDVEMLKEVPEGVTAETILTRYSMNVLMVKSKDELDLKLAEIAQVETISKARIEEYNATILAYQIEGSPNKNASIIKLSSPMGTQIMQKDWFDGASGGKTDQMGISTDFEGNELEKLKKPNFLVPQMYYMNDKTIMVELMGIADLDGVDHYKLKITDSLEDGDFSYEYFDVNTGMLTMREVYSMGENDEPITIIYKMVNYKDFNGLYIPEVTKVNNQGQELELKTLAVMIGNKVKSKAYSGDFKKALKAMEAY